MSKIKVVHYINQFFAQIGGEEKADYPAEIRVGEVVGPGLALTQNFKDEAEIIATVICGDSYFNENLEKAKADILAMVKEQAPDVFIAGPAFNAGRYGVACGTIAAAVQEELGIPAVTGMYVENPGADMFNKEQCGRYEGCSEETCSVGSETGKRRKNRFICRRRIYPKWCTCKLLRKRKRIQTCG